MIPELRTKEYPNDYPSDAVRVLDAMSMGGDFKLFGSMSLRSQLYSGDYDGYEVIHKKGSVKKVLTELRKRFQDNIKKLRVIPNTWVCDIKAGSIEKWRVIPRTALVRDGKIEGYNATQCRAKVDRLLKDKIISENEATFSNGLLKDSISVSDFLEAKQFIKYHTIRWTIPEVLHNTKILRDGSKITLEYAFNSPGIAKLDCISIVGNNRFTDFSVIYELLCNGKALNPDPANIRISLQENIIAYGASGNYFKVIKRMFALAKLDKDQKMIEKLTPILNSNLGLLYLIVNDIDTLTTLLEQKNVPLNLIRYEIDQFVHRLSNVYTVTEYLKKDDTIIGEIHRILKLPKEKLKPALENLKSELDSIVQLKAKPIVDRLRN
jgi:hypothetical protein